MATAPPSRRERAALADLMLERGPDARTLCEGWTARDLAAHLVLRERNPIAASGMVLPPLAGLTDAAMRRLTRDRTFPKLVDLIRCGPPVYTPWGLSQPIESAMNTVEFFVHHEDLRRTAENWEPRQLDGDLEAALWKRLTASGRLITRKAGATIIFRRTSGDTVRGGAGEQTVEVKGGVGELTMFAFGRQSDARVELSGPADAQERVRSAKLGL